MGSFQSWIIEILARKNRGQISKLNQAWGCLAKADRQFLCWIKPSKGRGVVFLSKVRIRQTKAKGQFFFFENSNICRIYTNIYLILTNLMERQFCLDRLSDPEISFGILVRIQLKESFPFLFSKLERLILNNVFCLSVFLIGHLKIEIPYLL